MRTRMIRLLLAVALCAAAATSVAGEVLYNGIVLPDAWPKVAWEDIKARKPIAEPPYLKDPPKVIPIDVGRQLFVDDFLIAETTLRRTYHAAEYHPANPVFTGGMPFSGGVFWDPQDQRAKMWYHGAGGTGYTTSTDGIHWEPGRIVLPGTTDSQCVWLDLEEKDPTKRFKMTRSVIAENRCRGWIYFSADGIDWRHVGYTGDWGDRSTFYWNPFRKVWVMSCRHGWGQPRARRYWEVKDMEHGPYWRSPGQPDYAPFWIGADLLDPERPDYRIAPELYNLDAAGYESLMLGMFTIWRGQPPPREKPNEVCLGFSRDGFHWTRPERRAFCPVSETPGAWNYTNVQSAAGGCLVMGDRLYFYVSARGKGRVAGLATLRRDGFASMDADSAGGTLTTRVLTFQGKYPFVNLDAPQGQLRVEILDASSKPIAPFTRDNCVPVRGDHTLALVRWTGANDLSALAGKSVRFRFHLTSGKLYAFWVSPEPSALATATSRRAARDLPAIRTRSEKVTRSLRDWRRGSLAGLLQGLQELLEFGVAPDGFQVLFLLQALGIFPAGGDSLRKTRQGLSGPRLAVLRRAGGRRRSFRSSRGAGGEGVHAGEVEELLGALSQLLGVAQVRCRGVKAAKLGEDPAAPGPDLGVVRPERHRFLEILFGPLVEAKHGPLAAGGDQPQRLVGVGLAFDERLGLPVEDLKHPPRVPLRRRDRTPLVRDD